MAALIRHRFEGISLGKGAILFSLLGTALVYSSSLWLAEPADAKIMGGVILSFNYIPATAALLILGPFILAGVGAHALTWAWLPLTVALAIPYWLWIEKRAQILFERRVDEEMERRTGASASNRKRIIKLLDEGSLMFGRGLLAVSVLCSAVALWLFWIGDAGDARNIGKIIMILNFIPSAGTLPFVALLLLLGVKVRTALLMWIPLTLALAVPFWLWTDKRLRRRFERMVAEELERRRRANA